MPAPGQDEPRPVRRRPVQPPRGDERPTEVIPSVEAAPVLPPPVRRGPPQPPPEPLAREDDDLEGTLFADDGYEDEYDEAYDEYEDYDEDAEEDIAEPEYIEDERPASGGRKKKRAVGWIAAIAVIVLLAGGAWYGFNAIFGYDDFEGAGEGDVLVQVDKGDSTSAIGVKLASAGVVASSKAFVKAGEDNTKITRIQQGYYQLKTKMSGASAVDKLVDPKSRVGQLQIKPYTQLDDITQPNGGITPGVYTLMSKASCADLNGQSTCVPVEQLRKTVSELDLAAAGIPAWAAEPASKIEQKDKRIEGLIAPGVYDVKPGWTSAELVADVIKASVAQIQDEGLSEQQTGEGKTAYQTLIIASIIEREAIKADFGKISRVIYNRLDKNIKLEMDSTVNYVLDKPTLRTKAEDRDKAGAYNTYHNTGLPPTPISVPSREAIQAALKPPPGDWIFFVKCEKDGQSCFAVTYDDHKKNAEDAQARGIY